MTRTRILERLKHKCSGYFAVSVRDLQRRERYSPVRLALAIVTLLTAAPVMAWAAKTAGPQKPSNESVLQVVARVNGEDITRNELGEECLLHYGEDVLERMTKKLLIIQECKKRGIQVTQEEVNAEINRMATRFSLPVDHWLKMLKEERGINPTQYSNDIIYPTLALRKIAQGQLTISQEELKVEYEKYYGPSVKARMIACKSPEKAKRLHQAVLANPAEFGNVAKNESEDVNSASIKGLVNPIRRHLGYKEIEDAAFSLQPGQISNVISVADQYVILKCEGHIPGQNVDFEAAKERLEESISESKLRAAAGRLFDELQSQAQVVNVFNDPDKSREMPGVAALINGNRVSVADLAEMCIDRHGEEVLEGTISRRLLEQECKRKGVTVTDAEIDAEIANAAAEMLELRPDGTPDVQKWLALYTEQQGVTVEIYRRDTVWPSVALRKLVGASVKVNEEDIRKGFEANFGERVRCLAIVLDNHRRAQEVWRLARTNPTREHFGDLAEQYSVEAGSRALRGEVPPIQKNGGQPLLEREAFSLSPGEISSIIQVDQSFVILLCEGRTKPEMVELSEVRDNIYKDVHRKKLNHAMGNYFQQLRAQATIDNFVAGTTQSPKKATARPSTAVRPVDMNRVVK
jgi:parvulin-like peptidyl-prolyl isomerase